MNALIKSAIAKRYYLSLNREYDTEGARKQFNQDTIDLDRLIQVIGEAFEEEIEHLMQLRDEQT